MIALGWATLALAAAIYVWAAVTAVRQSPTDRLRYGRWSATGRPRRLTVLGLFVLAFGMQLVARHGNDIWFAAAAAFLIASAATAVIWLHNRRLAPDG